MVRALVKIVGCAAVAGIVATLLMRVILFLAGAPMDAEGPAIVAAMAGLMGLLLGAIVATVVAADNR